jgi:hypothetical protein
VTFLFDEMPDTRGGTSDPPTQNRVYVATGEFDENVVKANAYVLTPAVVALPEGLVYRNQLSLRPAGYDVYYVDVAYGENKNVGEWTFRFDTTGGTINIKASKETVAVFPPGDKDRYGGLIGVNKDDVDGADVVIPALKWTIDYKHPQGVVDIGYSKLLAEQTGKVNSDVFLQSFPGEVLFLGGSGGDGTTSEMTVSLQFAFSPNLSGKIVGAITDIEQQGWHVPWIKFKDDVAAGLPVKQPEFVFIERVREYLAMASFFGFGG